MIDPKDVTKNIGIREREYRERQCRLFLKTVSNLPPELAVEGESAAQEDAVTAATMTSSGGGKADLFLALVDRVIVGEGLRFLLRDGTKWTV